MAAPIDTLSSVTASRGLPIPQADGQIVRQRADRYGSDVIGLPTRRQAADEGAYFVVTNPTPGTGIIVAAAGEGAAFAASTKAAIFAFFNGNKPGGKRIYLDRFKMLLGGTAPTGTLYLNFDVSVDSQSRLPTQFAASPGLVPVNVNGDDPTASAMTFYFATASPLTLPAASSAARIVARGCVPTGVAVIGDVYEIVFGADDVGSGAGALTAARATAAARIVEYTTPVIVGPQQWCVFRPAWITAGANAWTTEFELGFIEK